MWPQFKNIREKIQFPACIIALGFGTSLLRVVPGTSSTLLVGVPLYYLLSNLSLFYYNIVLTLFIGFGILACSIAEEVLGNRDDGMIVWDEICGYLLTMVNAPQGFGWVVLGFLLFRVFDIAKPWPIYLVERHLEGGLSIMLDDLLAAICANSLLHLLRCFL